MSKVGADDHLTAGGRLEDLERVEPPAPNTTDLGNSERLVRLHGPELRYVFAHRRWLDWNRKVWAADAGDRIRERAKLVARAIMREAAEAETKEDRAKLGKWAVQSESERAIKAMIELAKSALAIAPDRLDADPHLFNADNGIVDCRTGQLFPHSPRHFMTRIAPVAYDPAARCEAFLAFLREVLAGDETLIAWLQKLFGTALVGQAVEQILTILWGAGANGKTTLLRLLLRTLGPGYAKQAAMTTFLVRRGDPIPNDLAALAGARLVVASESGNGRRLDEAVVKQLTGGDPITARFLNAEFFTFEPTFTLILTTNHRPEIRGGDHAIWRRIRLVPFTVTIPSERQDKFLLDRVLMPEAPGVLAWLVRGYLRWRAEGLDDAPAAVTAATADFKRDCDVVGPFLEDRCDLVPDDPFIFETSKTLYDAYRRHCEETGEPHPISNVEFGRRLADKGLRKDRAKDSGRLWRGIALRGDR